MPDTSSRKAPLLSWRREERGGRLGSGGKVAGILTSFQCAMIAGSPEEAFRGRRVALPLSGLGTRWRSRLF